MFNYFAILLLATLHSSVLSHTTKLGTLPLPIKYYHTIPLTKHSSKSDIRVAKCPKGYIQEAGFCVRPETINKTDVCPVDSFADGNNCVRTRPGNPVCDQGVYIGDLICKVTDIEDGRLECPDGSVYKAQQCFVGGMLQYCPVGSAETDDGKCAQIVAIESFCAPDQQDVGDLCLIKTYADLELRCPENTSLVEGRCIAEIIRDEICPIGFADVGKQCAVYEPRIPVCEAGLTINPETLACETVSIIKATAVCADGGKPVNGKCEKIVEGTYRSYCEVGELIKPELCEVVSFVPPQYKCPEHYTLEKTPHGVECVTEVTYDCSYSKYECDDKLVQKPKRQVTKGHTKAYIDNNNRNSWNGNDWSLYGRKLKAVNNKGYGHTHAKGYTHDHHEYCHSVKVYVPKTCTLTKTADPIAYCGAGTFNGKECELKDVFPAGKKCNGIETPEGNCVFIETYKPVLICKEGYSPIDDGSKCEQKQIFPPVEICPDGTDEFEGKCAKFVRKECPSGGCTEIITWTPEAVCPIDFTLHRTGQIKSGHHYKFESKTCLRKDYYEKETRCPTNTTPFTQDTCISYIPPISVDDNKNVAPEFICPIGYAVVGQKCEITTFREANLECPKPFTPIFDTEICEKIVNPILECPKGSRNVDGECVVVVKVKPYFIDKTVLKVQNKANTNWNHVHNIARSRSSKWHH